MLAGHFLERYASPNGSAIDGFTPALRALVRMRWGGNVRELENAVENSVILARGPRIECEDLPRQDGDDAEDFFARVVESLPTLEELESRYIRFVLEKTGGPKEKASQILGMSRRTLHRRKEMGTNHVDGKP